MAAAAVEVQEAGDQAAVFEAEALMEMFAAEVALGGAQEELAAREGAKEAMEAAMGMQP